MSILTDIWGAIHAILTTSGVIPLVLMAVVAIAAGFMMQSFNSIVSATVIAMLAFALATYAYSVVRGANATASAQADWHSFLDLHMLTLLAYTITFAVAIAVVHGIRSAVLR
jgi:hypothetical protein